MKKIPYQKIIHFKIDAGFAGWLGLIMSFLGALLLTISIAEDTGSAAVMDTGHMYYTAMISPFGVRYGLEFMVLGFFYQIFEKALGEERQVSFWKVFIFSILFYFILQLIINFLSSLLFK